MSGNNQHHIWQMLQRSFGEKRGKDHHVWVYKKGATAKQTVTRLFGVQKHFYGPEDSEADRNITKYESLAQSKIQEARILPNGSAIDTTFAATLITHLEVRTQFLRNEFSSTLSKSMGGLSRKLTSPHKLRAMMITYLRENPDKLHQVLGKELIHLKEREEYFDMAFRMLEARPDSEILKSISPSLEQLGNVVAEFPAIAKDGQNRALELDFSRQIRTESHQERLYSVLRPTAGSFILPDTTLAFIKDKGASPISQKGDRIEAVLLPIASDAAIFGRSSSDTEYSLKAINRLLAGCSANAFLGKNRNAFFESLTSRIGRYARLLSDRDLKELIEE